MWISRVVLVAFTCALCSCTGFKRVVRVPNSYRVMETGNAKLEAGVKRHVDSLLFHKYFQGRHLEFSGDILVKTVPAVRKDRLGVPFWTPRERTRDRSGGLTVFTGRNRPVIIIIAVLEDGSWDERTLRHECCHVVLLWNGISGHPREFARLAPLWY
ncbi:MAG: hypothetical protein ACR2OZ_13660 [Verrucomicrobiales bacterium]